MGMVKQYDIYLINLNPSIGYEIQKTRPGVIISPDEINLYIKTVIIAPMTTKSHMYPTRVQVNFNDKIGWIVLDQIKTIDKKRCLKKLGRIDDYTIKQIKDVIKLMFVD